MVLSSVNDILFAAFRILREEGLNVELHIAGRGTDSLECRRQLSEGMFTYGLIDKQGVKDLLYQSDTLVLASRSEVQPLVLLEAMSTGIPVISTECIPQDLRIDEGCVIVPIDDIPSLAKAMKERVQAPAFEGAELSNKIRLLASPEVVGKKIETILSEIISLKKQ